MPANRPHPQPTELPPRKPTTTPRGRRWCDFGSLVGFGHPPAFHVQQRACIPVGWQLGGVPGIRLVDHRQECRLVGGGQPVEGFQGGLQRMCSAAGIGRAFARG